MRRAAKRDDSEPAIVDALHRAGCLVERLERWDLLVSKAGRLFLLECKTGVGRATRRQERGSLEGWPVVVVRTPIEALRAVGALAAGSTRAGAWPRSRS
jgi:hypothetical protein